MSGIKQHQCPSCGGNLNIDNEKQLYRCPFCGSTFDYAYFDEEQAMELGQTYLSREEYDAAKDLYKFLLKKDPHDTMALRGLMMASASCNDIKDLMKVADSEGFSYEEEDVKFVLENCSEKDSEYFRDLSSVYSGLKELSDVTSEHNSLREEKKKIEVKRKNLCDKYKECLVPDRYGSSHEPKPMFFIMLAVIAVLTGLLIWLITLVVRNSGDTGAIITVVFAGLIFILPLVLVDLLIVLPKLKESEKIKAELESLDKEASEIQEKVDKLNDEMHDRSSKVKHSCLDLSKKDEKITAATK
ncbi:MAG: hypothetical protein J5883_06350 [Clostridiales bacterium]|nr:hypothetical protein [Clostridiales bacterium]